MKQRNALFRPGTLRRRYDQQMQTTIFAPSQANKRSKQKNAEIDADLNRRANSIGGSYQLIGIDEEEEPEEIRDEGEIEQAAETEKKSCAVNIYRLWTWQITTPTAKKQNTQK